MSERMLDEVENAPSVGVRRAADPAVASWSAAFALAGTVLALMVACSSSAVAQARHREPSPWQPHLGLHVGVPQGASVAVGALRVLARAPDFTSESGLRIVLEPGLRAGRVRAGYARTGSFAIGYALEAAVLREWGRDGVRELPRTSLGMEVHGSALFMNAGVGFYAPRGGGAGRMTFSVGLVLS